MHIPRSLLVALSSGGLALALSGCGQSDPTPAVPAATPEAPAPAPTPSPSPAAAPERQVISAEMDANVAGRKLPKRDTPLEVGATAPALADVPAGSPAIVVFYRGHW